MALTSTATAHAGADNAQGHAKGPHVELTHRDGAQDAGSAVFLADGWGTEAAQEKLLALGWHVTGEWTISSPQGEPLTYSAPVEYRS